MRTSTKRQMNNWLTAVGALACLPDMMVAVVYVEIRDIINQTMNFLYYIDVCHIVLYIDVYPMLSFAKQLH